MIEERWLPVVGFEGKYEVSDLGNVRSLNHPVRVFCRGREGTRISPGRMLRPGRTRSGHVSVAIGKGNSRLVHQLVAEAFIGPRPEAQEVRHRNGIPCDNRLVNLHYGTRSQNIADKFYHGYWQLSPAQLTEILEVLSKPMMYGDVKRLAERYGVRPATITDIRAGRRYKHARVL